MHDHQFGSPQNAYQHQLPANLVVPQTYLEIAMVSVTRLRLDEIDLVLNYLNALKEQYTPRLRVEDTGPQILNPISNKNSKDTIVIHRVELKSPRMIKTFKGTCKRLDIEVDDGHFYINISILSTQREGELQAVLKSKDGIKNTAAIKSYLETHSLEDMQRSEEFGTVYFFKDVALGDFLNKPVGSENTKTMWAHYEPHSKAVFEAFIMPAI